MSHLQLEQGNVGLAKERTIVLDEVLKEMERQVSKFGIQNHPFYTAFTAMDYAQLNNYVLTGDVAKTVCDSKALDRSVSYLDILIEEVMEAADEGRYGDIEMARMELVQVAAVAISAIESIDRNRN